jgi:hypothetical protein
MIRKALYITACMSALALAAPQSFGEPTNQQQHAAASGSACAVPVRTHQQELGGVAQAQTESSRLQPSQGATTNPVPFPATPHQKQVLRGSQQKDVVSAAPGEPDNSKLVNGMPATEHQMQVLRPAQMAARGATSSEQNIGGC